MKQRHKGWLQLLLVILIGVGAYVLSEWIGTLAETPSPEGQGGEQVMQVQMQTIQPEARAIRFDLTGAVEAKNFVRLVPEVSGRVVEVDERVYVGNAFPADTVLFRVEPEDYQLRLQDRRAKLSQAKKALTQQQAETEAAKAEWRLLHPDEEPPALVARLPQLKQARAQVASARAALRQARLDLQRASFTLPFAGRVASSSLEEGQFVTVGQSYGTVYRKADLEVQAPVTSRQKRWLKAINAPKVTLEVMQDGERNRYPGQFARIESQANPQTRFQDAIFTFNHVDEHVLPGLFAKVMVEGQTLQNLWVLPIAALQEDQHIWVVDEQQRLQHRTPEIVQITTDYALAKSDGTAIQVVTQVLRTATQGTKVEDAGE